MNEIMKLGLWALIGAGGAVVIGIMVVVIGDIVESIVKWFKTRKEENRIKTYQVRFISSCSIDNRTDNWIFRYEKRYENEEFIKAKNYNEVVGHINSVYSPYVLITKVKCVA